jgi:protein-L-isoaspartate(D-aspartate) O-methyltransferase
MHDFAALRQRMVDNQIRPSEVTDHDLIKAFLSVPREVFVDEAERPFAYSDRELRLPSAGAERRMIDPVQLARLLQELRIGPDADVMIVAAGTGYSTALVARIASRVVAVEEDERLAARAEETLGSLGVENATIVRAPLTAGCPAGAPYDVILVDGAVEVVPDALVLQLKADGRLAAIERQERISRAMLYERIGDRSTKWPLFEAWATLLPGFERKREFVF